MNNSETKERVLNTMANVNRITVLTIIITVVEMIISTEYSLSITSSYQIHICMYIYICILYIECDDVNRHVLNAQAQIK